MIRPTLRSVATSLTIGALWLVGAWTLASCRDAVPAPVTERAQLTLVVAGLPRGAAAGVQVTGPSGYARTVDSTTVLGDLLPGRYVVRAGEVRAQGALWSAATPNVEAQLVAGDTIFAAISYAVASGAVRLTISGLPSGAAASVRLTGPNGLQRSATGSVTFAELPPGEYTVIADSIQTGGTGWRGPAAQTVPVPASLTPVAVQVDYRRVSGRLVFVASGTPADARATARIQGPLLTDTLVASGTVLDLPVGSHVITPLPALRSGSTPPRLYVPVLRSVTRALTDAAVDTVVVPYTANAGPINLTLENVIITQAVQRGDNGIPLVAGRDALLRAFVVADREGLPPPRAVVRLYEGSTQIGTLPMTAPVGSLPLVTREGLDGRAYTARLAPDLVRNSLRLVVDIDPDSSVGEVQRGDNVWPGGGAPRALTTVNVPPFVVRFVPVVVGGRAPELSASRAAEMMSLARAMWPLATVDFDIRAPYVSAVTSLQPTDADGGWSTVLSELRALRVLDGAPAGVHYYGVVSPTYSSGVFGLGLVGSPTSVGWDRDDAAQVATHEWGHNFGRTHSPCGDPPGIDAFYPTVGGATASAGWDVRSNRIVAPLTPDIMGYCANAWVSEYSYTRALAFRQNTIAARATASSGSAYHTSALLLAGHSRQGHVQMAPPRPLRAEAALLGTSTLLPDDSSLGAPQAATHRLELLDAEQRVMRRYWVQAEPVDHAPDTQIFAVVIPQLAGLHSIRLSDLRHALGAATVEVGEQPAR